MQKLLSNFSIGFFLVHMQRALQSETEYECQFIQQNIKVKNENLRKGS